VSLLQAGCRQSSFKAAKASHLMCGDSVVLYSSSSLGSHPGLTCILQQLSEQLFWWTETAPVFPVPCPVDAHQALHNSAKPAASSNQHPDLNFK
jgi:hypothetical protein